MQRNNFQEFQDKLLENLQEELDNYPQLELNQISDDN